MVKSYDCLTMLNKPKLSILKSIVEAFSNYIKYMAIFLSCFDMSFGIVDMSRCFDSIRTEEVIPRYQVKYLAYNYNTDWSELIMMR